MRKIVTIVGARPQFIKAAALSRVLRANGLEEILVHTGQHYDRELSELFFEELDIPRPNHHLDVGSGTHGAQTGAMLQRLEPIIAAESPDWVLVYGDTNSTLAGALAAAKLNRAVAHVEAGLRSFNRAMPEEINRVLTDHVSSLLFCPTSTAVKNLAREGITTGVHHVGDVMKDVAVHMAQRAENRSRFSGDPQAVERSFILVTIHRAENTDAPERMRAIVEALESLAEEMTVLFPVHPRTRARMDASGLKLAKVRTLEPLGPLDMAFLERRAAVIVTDSGGVQKEAYFHGTPCVTVRTETEWVETVESGWNRLASPDRSRGIVDAVHLARASRPTAEIADYGTGSAAMRIASILAA